MRNNAIVADLTAPASREHVTVDWPGQFAFWLGSLPVVAISWKFAPSAYGIEDLGFWPWKAAGGFLAVSESTRSPCKAGEAPSKIALGAVPGRHPHRRGLAGVGGRYRARFCDN